MESIDVVMSMLRPSYAGSNAAEYISGSLKCNLLEAKRISSWSPAFMKGINVPRGRCRSKDIIILVCWLVASGGAVGTREVGRGRRGGRARRRGEEEGEGPASRVRAAKARWFRRACESLSVYRSHA